LRFLSGNSWAHDNTKVQVNGADKSVRPTHLRFWPLRRRHFAAIPHNVRIHAEAHRQLHTLIEFNQCFQDFLVHMFGGLVGANAFRPEQFTHSDYPASELLFAVGIGGDVGLLPDPDLVDISFIDIHANPQDIFISYRQNRVRYGRGIGDAFAIAMVLAQNGAVDRRFD